MSGIESVGDLDGKRKKGFDLQRTPSNTMLQRHAVQEFHDNERLISVFADFVDRADVGMVESGSCPSLAAEAFQCLRVLRNIVGQEFQRDKAAEFGILGLVDHTHAAATQLLDDAVMRDGLADHADAMLGALQWEVNVSYGLFRILIPGAQAWPAGVWWPHPSSSPEPDRFLPGNSASRCVDLGRSGQTRSPSNDLLPQRGPSRRP